jgi:PAS domain S-box-containing protein
MADAATLGSKDGGKAPIAPEEPGAAFLGQSELARWMRAFDWGSVPIGVPETWPQSLKTAVSLMLSSHQPTWIGWGPGLTCLYNDACRSMIDVHHPHALGRPAADVWRTIWSDIGPVMAAAMKGGQAVHIDPRAMIVERNGRRQEAYYSFSCSPIRSTDGHPDGVFCVHTDDTRRVIGERQLKLLRELSVSMASTTTHRQACEQVARALATDPHDLPFVLVYLAEPSSAAAELVAVTGIDADDHASIARLSLAANDPWPSEEVLRSRRPSLVGDLSQRMGGRVPCGPRNTAPTEAVVLPIIEGEIGRGVMIVGLNPFRAFDDDYAGFLDLIAAHVAAAMAGVDAKLIREVAEHERAEHRFQYLVQGVRDYALFMLDPQGIITNWNTGAERIKGYRADEIIGQHFSRFYTAADREAGVPVRALATAAKKGSFEAEGTRVRKDGSEFWASVVINSIRDKDDNLVGFAKITRDITERRDAALALQRTQEQLAQAQKMEGIGQLTGGVAHDFNNLLTVIIGNLEAVQRALRSPQLDADRVARSIDNAMRGADRAASLTQRLLAFSRRQPLDPKPVDAGRLLVSMSDLLRRTLGEHVAIETVLAGRLWQVLADPNQLEVSILNLAVNARDAMPNGGRLTIETANAYLDATYAAAQPEIAPGQYVVISITDTGVGMSKEVQARAFEPFYTTKDVGHGTGLGLSQVYGFVTQSGGHVRIYSEVGRGTTVKLYLPRHQADDVAAAAVEEVAPVPCSTSGQTILVVEDDDDVRAHTTAILRELGYTVLEASVASSALHQLERRSDIKLLFTDIGLPGGMNGRQLADVVRQRRPTLKVLLTTGYARNAMAHDSRPDPGMALLLKPFTYAAVAAKLADLLDEPAGSSRVLLVEDEVLVRMVVSEQLQGLGYQVETAGSARDAMNKVTALGGDVALAIIDVGLPDIKGDLLASELRTRYPRLSIVMATGYEDSDLRQRFVADDRVAFLHKPYSQADLERVLARRHRG